VLHNDLGDPMPAIEWNETSLNMLQKTNEQSDYLRGLLDKAYQETTKGEAIENFPVLLDALTDYATAHFYFIEHIISKIYLMEHRGEQHEDATVSTFNLTEHREQYKHFIEMVGELKNHFYCTNTVPLQVLSPLITWLTQHKLKIDPDWQLTDHGTTWQ
jgi:hemerythrin